MDGWVWSNGGMILTGETEVLGENHYTEWVVDGWMSMEQRWNDTDRGNIEVLWENPVLVPLCPPQIRQGPAWVEPKSQRWEAETNCLSHGEVFKDEN